MILSNVDDTRCSIGIKAKNDREMIRTKEFVNLIDVDSSRFIEKSAKIIF